MFVGMTQMNPPVKDLCELTYCAMILVPNAHYLVPRVGTVDSANDVQDYKDADRMIRSVHFSLHISHLDISIFTLLTLVYRTVFPQSSARD